MAVGLRRISTKEEFLSICPKLSSYTPSKDKEVTTIFWVRHAESESNTQRIYTGRDDSPLSKNGKKQARKLNAVFKDLGVKFDGSIRSPLTRTKQTIELAAEGLFNEDAEHKTTKKLHERFVDKFEGVSLFDPDYLKFREIETKFLTDPSKSFEELMAFDPLPGTRIENFKQIEERAFKALKKLPQGKTFIAGSHSGTTRAVFWTPVFKAHQAFVDYERFRPGNTCVLVFEIKGDDVQLKAMEGVEFISPKGPSAH